MKKLCVLIFVVLPCLTSAQTGPLAPALLVSATTPESVNSQPETPLISAGEPASSASDSGSALPAAPVPSGAQTDQNSRRFQGDPFAFGSDPGSIQLFFGYTFTRFEGFPLKGGVTGDGYNFGMAFFPSNGNFGIEGQLMVTYGSVHGQLSRFLLGMGGPTVRIQYDEGQVAFFLHGLAGEAHMSPQTADGSEDEPGFQVGGGMDLKGKHTHWALRLQADMVGTRFYNTTQFSPRIGVGVVFQP